MYHELRKPGTSANARNVTMTNLCVVIAEAGVNHNGRLDFAVAPGDWQFGLSERRYAH